MESFIDPLREKIERDAQTHFEHVFDKMVKWALYNQGVDFESPLLALGVDQKEVVFKALENVLEKYRKMGRKYV